ncbi:YggT family protein [Treponema medium]|uniref:YggT family protein n=1 Tax=Treponema medium TaxID=58231 RepID=UPI001981BB3E|nr:YggT family protein [Treponema medium]QSH92306.1 YggT family protein [Treponema medium]QSH92443.1 YggT family protein [Treponema medium]
MVRSLLLTVRQLINAYLFLCFIKILLSWVPSAAYSSFGRVLSSICDPYLNWFRRFRFTRIGMVDFSPMLSLGILSIAAQLITSILATGTISLWVVFVSIIQLVWSFIGFMLNLLIIFLIIRLGYDLFGSSSSSPFWYNLDKFLSPVIAKVTVFFPRKPLQYRTRLILTILMVLLLRIVLGLFVGSLLFQFKVIKII